MLQCAQIIEAEQLIERGIEMHHVVKSQEIDCYIGIGRIDKGILGYRSSYQDALHSISILKQLQSKTRVTHIDEWGILQLITQVPPEARQNYIDQFLDRKSTRLNSSHVAISYVV